MFGTKIVASSSMNCENFSYKGRRSKLSRNLFYHFPVVNLIKHLTIVIYNSTVVLTTNLPNNKCGVIIYDCKMFIRSATGQVVSILSLYAYDPGFESRET